MPRAPCSRNTIRKPQACIKRESLYRIQIGSEYRHFFFFLAWQVSISSLVLRTQRAADCRFSTTYLLALANPVWLLALSHSCCTADCAVLCCAVLCCAVVDARQHAVYRSSELGILNDLSRRSRFKNKRRLLCTRMYPGIKNGPQKRKNLGEKTRRNNFGKKKKKKGQIERKSK